MTLNYNNQNNIIKRLENAHNKKVSNIRSEFFYNENKFFKSHIKNAIVLVAGSGLGHDSFTLAKHNKKVIGLEFLPKLISIANKRKKELKIKNVLFKNQDITKTNFKNNYFDYAIFNMGTIGNFEDKQKLKILTELLRVSKKVYFDFYKSGRRSLKIRKKMYEQELWKNVRIENKEIKSSDGLHSTSLTRIKIKQLLKNKKIRIKFFNLNQFTTMTEIKKLE